MNTKQKGDIAIGNAIRYYLGTGFEVCLPIGDKRHYDLIIEKDRVLRRVQVKYAGLYGNGHCIASLRITGGNQSYNYAKKYEDNAFDELFVYSERQECYVITWDKVVCRNAITVDDKKYASYKC